MFSKTAQKAVDAYGGEKFWKSHKGIEAEVSATGVAFTIKQRPFFDHAKIKMEISRPFSKLTPIGKHHEITGVLNGTDVRLEDANGKVLATRKDPRKYFPYGRRLFYWDDLDMTYFANYAFWNYFTLPNLLLNETIKWTEVNDGLLEAEFPPDIPTHSKVQRFYFDQTTGLIKEHDYTVDIMGNWAHVANVVDEHKLFNGVPVATRRKVTPKLSNGKILNFPIMIDINVLDLEFVD